MKGPAGASRNKQAGGVGHAKKRARDLGIPLSGTPGTYDAITDVHGVEVGHATLITGEGRLVVGKGPGAHRRHRDPPARQGCARSRLRRRASCSTAMAR